MDRDGIQTSQLVNVWCQVVIGQADRRLEKEKRVVSAAVDRAASKALK